MTKCLIDPRPLLQYDFGLNHPFKVLRLGLTYELISAYGLIDRDDVRLLLPREAGLSEAAGFHTGEYMEALHRAGVGMWVPDLHLYGLGTGDNPIFHGVYEWAMQVAGASIDCATEVAEGKAERAFNLSGGLHHAMPEHASGFCHINDVVLAIQSLVDRGQRVAYVDIDAHHGDGVQHAFYETSSVLTVSIHQTGTTIFPGTGFANEIGKGAGKGYAVNIPLMPGAGDDAFEQAFREIILPCIHAYRPDVLVTQLGADALFGDVVADLGMSLREFERCVTRFRRLDLPWLALGGGGYNVGNVVRAWTLAWGVMLNEDLPNEIPPSWSTQAASHGVSVSQLRGNGANLPTSKSVLNALGEAIAKLRASVLPILHDEASTANRKSEERP